MASTAIHVFSNIGETIESALVQPAQSIAHNLSSTLIPIVGAGITVWFMVYALSVTRGAVQMPFNDFVWRVFKISLILFFAIAGGIFQPNAFAFYSEISNTIYNAVYTAGGGVCPIPLNDPMGIYSALDCAAGEMLSLRIDTQAKIAASSTSTIDSAAWNRVLSVFLEYAIPGLLFLVMEAIAFVLTIIFLAYTGFEVISLRVSIALAFAISPLFFFALIFDPIKNLFQNWLIFVIRSIVFQAMFMVFMGVALAAITNLGMNILEAARSNDLAYLLLAATINAFAFAMMMLIFVFTAARIPRLASDLVGGAPDGAGVGTVLTAMAGKALAKAGWNKLRSRKKSGGEISG